MKYLPKLLLIYVIKCIYANSPQKPDQVSKEVDKLIGKILHAHKFNELADRIADRAVIKLSDFQKTTIINDAVHRSLKLRARRDKATTIINDPVYRSIKLKTGQDKANLEIIVPKKHTHGKIDVEAVLRKKVLPLDSLKLRYKNLKNLHYMTHLKADNKNSPSPISSESKNIQEVVMDLKQDYKKIKTIDDEIFGNPMDGDKTNKHPNMSPRTVKLEGNRTFAWMDSPDYKEYHEQLAKLKEALI